MKIKKLIRNIHLWLGLLSGLLVLFLGITGCILVFEKEITNLHSYMYVKEEATSYALPGTIKAAAEKALGGKQINSVEYAGKTKPAVVYFYNDAEYYTVYLNPYTAQVLKVKNMDHDFFRFILNGHYNLWMPREIGGPIVASATLVFVIMMITGLILWKPKNRRAAPQRFKIKFNAKWKRVNFDLHSVLGFYMSWVAIFIAVTGLVMGFEWFAKSFYYVTSAGKKLPEYAEPQSDTTKAAGATVNMADYIFNKRKDEPKANESFSIVFPADNKAPVEFITNHKPGTYYKQDYDHYDQYTGNELPATGIYAGAYSTATFANKLSRMNYDIHVGAVYGLTTKILAFFASLIAASLPVTGFLMWRGRKRKQFIY